MSKHTSLFSNRVFLSALMLAALAIPGSALANEISPVHATDLAITPALGQMEYRFELSGRTIVIGAARLDGKQFVKAEAEGLPTLGPVIWIQDAKGQKSVDLRPGFGPFAVFRAYVDKETKTAYALFTPRRDGDGSALIVLRTKDGGDSWVKLGVLKRPPFRFPVAELDAFMIDRKGRGKATFSMDQSMMNGKLAKTADEHGHLAVWVATTANGGASWDYSESPWAWSSLSEVHGAMTADKPVDGASPAPTPAKK